MRYLWTTSRALGLGLGVLMPGAGVAQTVPGVVWQVVTAGDLDLVDGDDATIEFFEGRITGRSGCNRFSGAVTLTAATPDAGALELGPLMGTRMACPGRGDQVEAAFLPALDGVAAYAIDTQGDLQLLSSDGAVQLRARRR